jgi:hypothetical protein
LKYVNSLAEINAYKYLKTFKGKDKDREEKGKERDKKRKVKLKFKSLFKKICKISIWKIN